MNLTESVIRDTQPGEKPIRLTDAHGLYLEVAVSGTKTFRMKYRFEGKRPTIKLGTYPEISLAQARNACAQVQAALADGINPKTLDFDTTSLDPMPGPLDTDWPHQEAADEPADVSPAPAEKAADDVLRGFPFDDTPAPTPADTPAPAAETAPGPETTTGDAAVPAGPPPAEPEYGEGTWGKVATDYLILREQQGLNPRMKTKIERQIEATRVAFGEKNVSEISTHDILDLIHPYEDKGEFETAREIRSWCSQVFDFAAARGFANENPAQTVRANLIQRRRGTFPEITDPREVAKTLEQFPDGTEAADDTYESGNWGRTIVIALLIGALAAIAGYWYGYRSGSEPTIVGSCQSFFAAIAVGAENAPSADDTERCTAVLRDYYGVIGN